MKNQEQETTSITTEERNKIFFCVNLKDHLNEQVFHLEYTDKYRFALMGRVKGENILGIGRYKIQNIHFRMKIFDNTKELYIKSVIFEDFVEGDNGVKNIAKFKVDVSFEEQPESSGIYNSHDIGVYGDAILDMNFVSCDNLELNKLLQQQKRKAKEFINFGGHICKSRVAF